MTDDHTMITASRAVAGPVDHTGTVAVDRVAFEAQRAMDQIYHRLINLGLTLNPRDVILDVRVTAFVPAKQQEV
jgi:hypothetical protein